MLLVSRKWPPAVGGMETYSVELAASLGEDFEIETLVLPGRRDGRTPSLLGYAWFVLRAMGFCLLRGRAYPNVVFGDLVLFPAAVCHWIVASKRSRLVIVYGLDLVYQTRPGLLPRLYSVFFFAFRRTQGVFKAIVAISRHTATIASKAGLRNVDVINPSLPVNRLTQSNAGDGTDTFPKPWLDATKRVLYFGRLVPRKGALWFAESVLPQLDEAVEFFVVGQGADMEYRRRLDKCARTHCLGALDSAELAALIRNAHVVVMPNLSSPSGADVEGFGLAAIEATALGGRLLAADIEGLMDAVSNQVTGRLLPSGDTEAWVSAVTEALNEPIEGMERHDFSTRTRAIFSRHAQSNAFSRLLLLNDPSQ